MYLCGPRKHSCQPFCGPDGRFYCSDSVCSLWPAPFSYLCVSVRILCVCWKLSAAEQVKTDCCHTPAVVSTLLTPLPVSCPLTTLHHYIIISLTSAIFNVILQLTATGVPGLPGAPAAWRVQGAPSHDLATVTTRPPPMAALPVPVPAAIALPVTLRLVQVGGVPLNTVFINYVTLKTHFCLTNS